MILGAMYKFDSNCLLMTYEDSLHLSYTFHFLGMILPDIFWV
jgi:hypothetical protein